MIEVKEFTNKGIKEFESFISSLREKNPRERKKIIENAQKPTYLKQEPYSKKSKLNIEIDEYKEFESKLDIAIYLSNKFEEAGFKRHKIIPGRELFTWIAYLWLDQLCKPKNGDYKIYSTEKYICRKTSRKYYRHFIAGPYYIYSLHGKEKSKLLLDSKPYIHKENFEQLAGRQDIISNPEIISVAHKLYRDTENDKDKKGVASKDIPGNIRRFGMVLDQLNLTYDIRSMDTEEIIEILPKEFNRWIPESKGKNKDR
ncbi:hypothetical protein AMET1_0422 [Methanonatronarchaeum thermophilum]|uniref:Uncharacterized protein n=1 Tax=Methanonatronarchaeum thermophilum TaxID=1927129 RepID=A0A1Y3GBD2_9EURY|nr:hypothetical protein [Methanonatronarchaeum thermophilum]OUJ18771.1 hypothetical protein AMET1_0422 [Methanonatronarchaeum thermophilum]